MTAAPAYQALYRACMKEAAGQGRALMQRIVLRAGDSLQRRAKLAPEEMERKLLAEAARTLIKHEAALCEAYPQALLAGFAQAIAGDARRAGTLSFDSLELMGDEQMRENVEQMRVQQAVMNEVEAELTELNALICAVQGLKSVQPDRNPLRPDVYVRSLRTVIFQSPIAAPMRARWTSHLGEALGPELARVYAELAGWLRSQGVAEARFVAVAPAQSAPEAAALAAAQPGSASLLNLQELRRLLSGNFDEGAGPQARRPDFAATMPAAVDALENMKQVDAVVQRLKDRQPGGHGAPAQLLAQEVVRLMLDNIAGDARLLAPVRQCVRDLEPAFMRLALADPRFFSDRKHPARRLLDELTQRSLAWESEQSPGFKAFIDPLRQAADVLRTTHVPGAEPFDFALGMLQQAWGDAQKRDRHHREKAVRALLQAEQRNLLAEKIAREMRNRPDLQSAPKQIAAFVAGPWAQVMAQARLADTSGATDPGGYTSAVADLVWSARPQGAATQTARLLRLVPGLVEKLRQGLATIDYPAPAAQRFLDGLAHAHRAALDAGDAKPSDAPPLSRDELEAMMDDDDDAPGAWLAPSEAQHSGFMDTQPSVQPKPIFAKTQPAEFTPTRPLADEAAQDLPMAELQPGSWVEMMGANGWVRLQVSWASPHGTLFMFTGASGQPQSMTRRLLGKMLRDGTVRLIAGQALVDGALDAVAEAALRNSLDAKS